MENYWNKTRSQDTLLFYWRKPNGSNWNTELNLLFIQLDQLKHVFY